MNTHKNRVLVIGLDGATFDLITPLVAEGKLPTMAKFMREGTYGPLQSVVPPISPPAWTTIITGQNPGKHGIYDFIQRAPQSYQLQSSRRDLSQLRTVFGLLSQAGKRVGVVNVPLTYPPEKVNGFMVSGLKSPPHGNWTYPPDLQERLQRAGYWIDLRVPYRQNKNEEAFIREMLDTAEMRVRTALTLMDEVDWDFFMVVFRGPDDALMLWHLHDSDHPLYNPELARVFGDGIERVYRAMDNAMTQLLDKAGSGTNTLVVSDHGGGPVYKSVYLNNWLRDQGWLQFKSQATNVSGTKRFLRRLGLTRDMGWKFLNPKYVSRIKSWFPGVVQWIPQSTPTMAEVIDWEHTYAYSFGYLGQIYINLQGREPQGIVLSGEMYDNLVEQITTALYKWKDEEDNQTIVDTVYRKGDIYRGPYVAHAPDLCLKMRNFGYITQTGQEFASRVTLGPPTHTGTHRLEGVFMAMGSDINTGIQLGGATLADIVPTILYLLDLPLPQDLDGKVLVETVNSALLKERPVRYMVEDEVKPSDFMSDDWSPEDEQSLMNHLKNLGYVG